MRMDARIVEVPDKMCVNIGQHHCSVFNAIMLLYLFPFYLRSVYDSSSVPSLLSCCVYTDFFAIASAQYANA